MEAKQEEAKKNDKEEHIAFNQSDYIKSINEKLITPLLPTGGVCSALSDLYIYYYFKHELSNVTPKEYKNFIEYLNNKLGYDIVDLENVAKFINVIQSINNSGPDINGLAQTVLPIKYDHNNGLDQDFHNLLDQHKCLKLSFLDHDIVIVQNGSKYSYFDNEEEEVKNLSYETLAKYVEAKIEKYKLEAKDGNQVLYIHYGKERIEAIFKDKEGKRALRQLFDDTKTYLDHLDALKTEDDKVKDHVSKTKVRVSKLGSDKEIDGYIKQAQGRNKFYDEHKAKLAAFVTENKTGEFDFTAHQTQEVALMLHDIVEAKEPIEIKKISLNFNQLNVYNIGILEKIIKNNENIILRLGGYSFTQDDSLFLLQSAMKMDKKYSDQKMDSIIRNILEYSVIMHEDGQKMVFDSESSVILLDFVITKFPNHQEIKKFSIKKPLNQQELELMSKIVREKCITDLEFSNHFESNQELMQAIIENKNIKVISLSSINEMNDQSIKSFSDILTNSSSINAVSLGYNRELNKNTFINLLDVIKNNKHITSLSLSINTFDDKMIDKLIEIIEFNQIKTLDISNIKISDQAAEKLFAALVNNQSITNLNLSELPNISNKQVAALLEKNQYSSIIIGDRDFKEGKGDEVFKAIRKNKALNHLEVIGCNFDESAKEEFINALKENTSIKSIKMYEGDKEFKSKVKDIIKQHNETPTPILYQASISNKNNEIIMQPSV